MFLFTIRRSKSGIKNILHLTRYQKTPTRLFRHEPFHDLTGSFRKQVKIYFMHIILESKLVGGCPYFCLIRSFYGHGMGMDSRQHLYRQLFSIILLPIIDIFLIK